MHILASDFSGLVWIFLAIPAVLIVLAVISFFPASRGHWAAPALAGPAVLVGLLYASLLLFASARSRLTPFPMCAFLLAPPVLGILALGVWSGQRRTRE
jgi:hypothetical protein